MFTGSGRVSYQLVPSTSPVAFVVTGGVGVINRSGEFYANVENKTDMGGTLGASARFRLGKLLHLQVSAEDYIYKPKAEIPGFGPEPGEEDAERHPPLLRCGHSAAGPGEVGQVSHQLPATSKGGFA